MLSFSTSTTLRHSLRILNLQSFGLDHQPGLIKLCNFFKIIYQITEGWKYTHNSIVWSATTMTAWMLTLAAHWHCLAFLLVLLFSASLLGKSVTSALTSIHILISTEDPTSSITDNRMLCSFPCKLNCRNNNSFFFVPLEKPFFYLSTPPHTHIHTLSFY